MLQLTLDIEESFQESKSWIFTGVSPVFFIKIEKIRANVDIMKSGLIT